MCKQDSTAILWVWNLELSMKLLFSPTKQPRICAIQGLLGGRSRADRDPEAPRNHPGRNKRRPYSHSGPRHGHSWYQISMFHQSSRREFELFKFFSRRVSWSGGCQKFHGAGCRTHAPEFADATQNHPDLELQNFERFSWNADP